MKLNILEFSTSGYRFCRYPIFSACAILTIMKDKTIREKFHTDGILDKAYSIACDKAGGEAVFVESGVPNMIKTTAEEVYIMGWRDAMAQAQGEINPFPPHAVSRDRVVKSLKEGEIDREAIENAKDVGKLDISVLGLSKRVYFKLQERGIRTIAELMARIERGDLKKVRGIGDTAYEEIVRQVRKAKTGERDKYGSKDDFC